MTPDRGRLRRGDRLRSRKDFQRLAREGARRSSRHFVILLAPSFGATCGSPRLGVTASRKVGNAIRRNRVKRGIREWFRNRWAKLPPGHDIVVIARQGAASLSSTEISDELEGLFR